MEEVKMAINLMEKTNVPTQEENERSVILPTNYVSDKVADNVNKYWKLQLLGGVNSDDEVYDYAVRFTSKAKNKLNLIQSVIISKEDLDDKVRMQASLKKLKRIGKIEQSYLVAVALFLDDAIYDEDIEIVEVEDMLMLKKVPGHLEVNLEEIRMRIENKIYSNLERFPTKESNQYDKEDSYGAILDHKKVKDGQRKPVAIRAGVLKNWINAKNSQQHREIIEELIKKGYIEGDLDDIGNINRPRLSKNITVAEKIEASAYQYNFIIQDNEESK